MKTSPFLIAVIASLLPSLTTGLLAIAWNVSHVPTAGLKDITFPFSIADSPHEIGYYFAQSFNFKNIAGVGYTGLQPRPDSCGSPLIQAPFFSYVPGSTSTDGNCRDRNPLIQALFFSYVPGSTSTDGNCRDGNPDGGEGVSCAVDFSGPYAHAYGVEVRNTEGTVWEGTVVDLVTNRRVHIGSYTLPVGSQGITGGQFGYAEYYPWATGVHSCDSLPYMSMAFGVPTTSTSGAGVASLGDAFEYGECVGEVGFEHRKTQFGDEVRVGFK